MPNIKSAKKRVKIIRTKTLCNQMVRSALKTSIKRFEVAVLSGDKEKADATYKVAIKKIDQAAAKGILHQNTAARRKSKLTLALNAIG